MATIEVYAKLQFVKAIYVVTKTSLYDAKRIADEILPSARENNIATFDPKKFGWTTETLKKICKHCNMYTQNIKVISYE